jgi:hypothetical protein
MQTAAPLIYMKQPSVHLYISNRTFIITAAIPGHSKTFEKLQQVTLTNWDCIIENQWIEIPFTNNQTARIKLPNHFHTLFPVALAVYFILRSDNTQVFSSVKTWHLFIRVDSDKHRYTTALFERFETLVTKVKLLSKQQRENVYLSTQPSRLQ